MSSSGFFPSSNPFIITPPTTAPFPFSESTQSVSMMVQSSESSPLLSTSNGQTDPLPASTTHISPPSSSSSPPPSTKPLTSAQSSSHPTRAGKIAGAVVGSLVACAIVMLIFLHTRRSIYRRNRRPLKFVVPGSKSKLDLAEAQTYHPQISEIRGRPEPFTFNMFPDPGLNSLGEKENDLQKNRRPQSLPAPLISSRWPLPIPAAFRMSSPAPSRTIPTAVQEDEEKADGVEPPVDIEAPMSDPTSPVRTEVDKRRSRARISRISFASTSDSGSQGSMVIGSKRFWAAIGTLRPPRINRRSRQ
ncbi:hypothetical protein SISSUDRAFT_1130005 [Sistotremastrum suecicum HHB10207 ss-3]|uniref:Uncharacterized protein n=1 Tax=Sistotremastrum suecicum HHB10207 ss-3 TaxID=1314776 RepID=A0A166C0L9_9AGAM|nr:hypothetical protein SISSUDRAFT_1130005 [Sistotremastrum suecicum HHB10207 ss-3]